MAGLGIQSPQPTSSSAAFQLPSSSSSNMASDDDDDAPLPFPAALPRQDFLAPEFHPATYLSDLPYRHQTLDDLKSDLRERSAAISAELLELVNANYTSFLSLGDELRGGGDKVGDVKVSMLGFRRQVEEIKGRVRSRKEEVEGLTGDLAGVRRDIEAGRRMLELDERVQRLEERLAVASLPDGAASKGENDDDDDAISLLASDEEEEEEGDGDEENEQQGDYPRFVGTSPAKLSALAREYCVIEALADAVGREKPFMVKLEPRMRQCRNTLLLDLNTAMREARRAGDRGKNRVIKYLSLYEMLDAQGEAIKVLKSD